MLRLRAAPTRAAPNAPPHPTHAQHLQAAILGGEQDRQVTDLLLLDVTPLSLGIAVQGGLMAKVVKRNSTIPVLQEKEFTTCARLPALHLHVSGRVCEGVRWRPAPGVKMGVPDRSG